MSLFGGLPIVGGLLGGNGPVGGLLGGLPIVGGFFSDPPQQAPYSPGVTSYAPQSFGGGAWPNYSNTQPQGNTPRFSGDLGVPGQAEGFFAQNQGKWANPGASAAQKYWDQNQGKFGAGGPADQFWNGVAGRAGQPPTTSNDAQGAYDKFNASVPADTSSYYNNAARKAREGIEGAYGARGMRGSSGELDQLAESDQNIFSNEALANANYGLQRAGLGGQLASGADVSSGRDIQNQLGWLTGMGGLATGVGGLDLNRLLGGAGVASGLDQNTLNWLNSGMTAALGAQGAEATRGQNFFNNTLGGTMAQVSPMIQAYMAMLGNDQALINAGLNASTGGALNNANMSQQNQASNTNGLLGGLGAMAGISNAGGLGGILAGFL